MSLRDEILEGSGPARLEFIAEGQSISAGRLAADGARWYSPDADEPVLAALLSNDSPSVALVLGAIATGATLVSIPLPGRAADVETYASFVQNALDSVGATRVIARDDIASLISQTGVTAVGHRDLHVGRPLAVPGSAFELIQFSSGSTATPKPILLSSELLQTNIMAILERVQPSSGDVTVSWLPLSHDMGLIGMLLSSLAAIQDSWTSGGEIVLIPPEQFLRDPAIWLRSVSDWRGTFTAAPDFGYRLACRAPAPDLDLSCLRHAIVGGEVIRWATLEAVDGAFGSAGLPPTALAPAYGMAELGLAATMTGPLERWQSVEHQEDPAPGSMQGSPATRLVSSGSPLSGYAIEIEPATHRIRIKAPAIGHDATTRQPLSSTPGSLLTNDTGFMADDGSIYVTGRLDDVLVVNGRNVSALDIEAAVAAVGGVRTGRVTAVGLPSGEWIIAAERAPDIGQVDLPGMRQAIRRITVSAASIAPDHIAILAPGALPMTSSGKAQRHEVRRRWISGDLAE